MTIPMKVAAANLLLALPASFDGAIGLWQAAGPPMAWQVERQAGPGARPESCAVVSLGRNVVARLVEDPATQRPAWVVLVGFDGQPGSLRYLRIDRKIYQTDRPGFLGAEAAEIVARLKAPGEVVYEWARRPDDAKQGGLFETGDFAAAAADCEDWMSGTGI